MKNLFHSCATASNALHHTCIFRTCIYNFVLKLQIEHDALTPWV